ncbi:RNA 2',3'-cyclic phosphodiesterase [Geobacter pickeringii]|uniref:RNA 2',3'-cyclic phosphodiesterase n=1 Tax=Geobacter pickeringii TaxID=345632 RepID=A0A0B5BE20_9BACT|nr:RNA 2',3'-cyclic phosphodiesterase [Geobacter pickeringii]AJE04727.1 2'-5' RNA ligase [Geobacter pickeringii]
MRLFVAIDLPDGVKQSVADLCRGVPGVRWLPPEQLHLTLRFIGEADEAVDGAIRRGLAAIVSPPFPLALRGVGCFPSPRRPRVLWVGLGGSDPLHRLQQAVEAAVNGAGVPAEERPFSPHITLARLREHGETGIAPFLARNASFQGEPFTVDAFYLYSSILTPQGAIHRREASYPLAG